jgi:glycosyltransferase involved in cell wall biosynthesis
MMRHAPIDLYDLKPADVPRWIPGDEYPRAWLRRMLRPFRGHGAGGLAKVTQNLVLGLDRLGVPYRLHHKPTPPVGHGAVGILNGPISLVHSLAAAHPCITGVGILEFPSQWPALFSETQARLHLQACEWAAAYYRPLYGDKVRIWPVGIDTEKYHPTDNPKTCDFLIYNKLRWPDQHPEKHIRETCLAYLTQKGLSYQEITYGRYPRGRENSYHAQLSRCRAMLFLCENETQGIAYNEALSMGVPILAWNPERWLDPNRHNHGLSDCPATSVPYWDDRCGEQFTRLSQFPATLDRFQAKLTAGAYRPRDYILENLTLEKCAQRYLDLLAEAGA